MFHINVDINISNYVSAWPVYTRTLNTLACVVTPAYAYAMRKQKRFWSAQRFYGTGWISLIGGLDGRHEGLF